MINSFSSAGASLWLVITVACLGSFTSAQEPQWQPSAAAIQAQTHVSDAVIRSHIRFLADDLLEGRGPGTRGDRLAQLYIRSELESLGIRPGGQDDSWYQEVPLRGVSTIPPANARFSFGDQSVVLDHHTDMMLVSGRNRSGDSLAESELVFVGFGIQAPEYDWDDFKDADIKGKILVVLNNDPEHDPELFAGRRRLYYGRWDYKYAMAARMGAAGALIIHTTASAGYPYQVVQTSWSGEEFELARNKGPRTKLKGWLTEDAARRIFAMAGKDLDQLRTAALSRDFRPVPLGVSTSVRLGTQVREQTTANVIGVLPGSDPRLKSEYVVFMAHHDHLGLAAQRNETGDNIYNGAVDNASGTASLLALAKAISEMPVRPKRSILFAFVGAEEQGLLGSKHLAADPPVAPGYLAACINIDGINFLGRTHDINLIGNGKSSLDNLVAAVANWQGRVVVPDAFPDRGYYYRSDQFSLAQIGVPGVYLHSGLNVVGKPEGWGKEQLGQWVEKTYHQPSDEYDDSWNLEGAVEDTRLLLHVGLEVAQRAEMPHWNAGDEFEAARVSALRARTK